MSKFLQATNLTWSDSIATSVFQNCPVIHCVISTYNEQFYKFIVKCYSTWFVTWQHHHVTKYKNPSSTTIN
jgi:acid phosphatase family membrane protein YuiD